MLSGVFLQVGFALTSFHLAEASLSAICFFVSLYYCPKISQNVFYNYSHFWYSFSNQLILFSQLENVSNLWNSNCTMYANKQKQDQVSHIQIDHAFYFSI